MNEESCKKSENLDYIEFHVPREVKEHVKSEAKRKGRSMAKEALFLITTGLEDRYAREFFGQKGLEDQS